MEVDAETVLEAIYAQVNEKIGWVTRLACTAAPICGRQEGGGGAADVTNAIDRLRDAVDVERRLCGENSGGRPDVDSSAQAA